MSFFEYIIWRISKIFQKKRSCDTCRGSNGHCDECDEFHNLYKKDWEKTYWRKHRW